MNRKLITLFLFVSLSFVSFTQMKRACYGIYKGKIESYILGKSNEIIQIEPVNIEIQILKNQLFVFIGDQKYEGTWRILLETKVYYLIEANTNSQAPERLMIYKNKRKILREGVSPQPNVVLKKHVLKSRPKKSTFE